MNGFYAAYLAGKAGTSFALFVITNQKLVGVDGGGLKYDGEIGALVPGQGFHCSLVYIVPPGANLITGVAPPSEPMRVPLSFMLPEHFANGSPFRIETPLGPVNARFEKIRDL